MTMPVASELSYQLRQIDTGLSQALAAAAALERATSDRIDQGAARQLAAEIHMLARRVRRIRIHLLGPGAT